MQSPLIAITLGDVTGIGPEVTLKAIASEANEASSRFLVIGDWGVIQFWNEKLGLHVHFEPYSSDEPNKTGHCFWVDPFNSWVDPLKQSALLGLPCGAPEAARAALAYLSAGADLCLRGKAKAVVTAPVNKETILRTGVRFVGQTEFLTDLAGQPRTAMMLLGSDDRGRWLRVALATTHVPIRKVADVLDQESVESAIDLAAQACRDLKLPRARIGVCGLNPHAGEGGKLGGEEAEIIGPAVRASAARGVDVSGPFAADTLFYQAFRGEFDVVVAMYHDQGLAPLKMVAFENGVNWTLGLPFVRTSPDHGTAYDIAGLGKADASSMRSAIRLALQLL